jgi:hypothetical protein
MRSAHITPDIRVGCIKLPVGIQTVGPQRLAVIQRTLDASRETAEVGLRETGTHKVTPLFQNAIITLIVRLIAGANS